MWSLLLARDTHATPLRLLNRGVVFLWFRTSTCKLFRFHQLRANSCWYSWFISRTKIHLQHLPTNECFWSHINFLRVCYCAQKYRKFWFCRRPNELFQAWGRFSVRGRWCFGVQGGKVGIDLCLRRRTLLNCPAASVPSRSNTFLKKSRSYVQYCQ